MAYVSEDDWRRDASCLAYPVEIFFPERGNHQMVATALKVCAGCPVRQECLDENLFQKDGVYGGTTARQRRQLRLKSKQTRTRRCVECSATFAPNGSQLLCSQACKSARHMRQRRDSDARNS